MNKRILVSLFLFCSVALAQLPQTRPNIIFIMTDDLGYGDLGSYGQKVIETPALDRMAGQGMRFTQAYAGSPVCAPSRSVLMTGQHTGNTRVRGNFSAIRVPELPKWRRIPLHDEDVTVAEVLQEAGYVTGMFGKWGLGEATTTGEPNRQGFDEWMGFLNQRRAHSHYPDYLWHNTEKLELPGNADGQRTQHTQPLFTDYALDFIDRHREENFFLYLPYCLPHSEFTATEPFYELYADREDWTEQEKHFAAMIRMIDADVGRLLAHLRASGLAENTLVFFCSDNGAANRYEGRFDSSGELRGRKRELYEGGIRTPMLVWMPESVPAGTVNDTPWYFPDVLPTLAALAQTDPPEGIDGINIAPTLFGKTLPDSDRFMYWEFHAKGYDQDGEFYEKPVDQAARWKDWKGIRRGVDGPLELYDLSKDPSEKHDLSHRHADVVETIESYLDQARSPSIYWPVEQASAPASSE